MRRELAHWGVALIAMTAVTVCSRTVTAQEATPVDAKAEPEPEHSSLGWILGLDGSAIALAELGILAGIQPNTCIFTGFSSGVTPSCPGHNLTDGGITLLGTGGFLYGLGAPTVHWVHHQEAAGFVSFGLHVLGGAVGGYVVYAEGIDGGHPGVAALAALPIFAIPTVVDALFMSSYRESRDSRAPKASWVPRLNLRHDGAVAGVDVVF
jgi:hypothetical protein